MEPVPLTVDRASSLAPGRRSERPDVCARAAGYDTGAVEKSRFSLLHSEGIHSGQRATRSNKRVLNLTRSAFIGQQRYGTVTWSGDVSATWDTLRRQIAEGLNFCATGLPYWTTDAGAFFVARRPELWFWAGDFHNGVEDSRLPRALCSMVPVRGLAAHVPLPRDRHTT